MDRPATEKEKMLAGELYLAADPELVAERLRARRLIAKYNSSSCDDLAARSAILNELFAALGTNAYIEPPFYCDYGSNIFVAENLYMNFGCVVLDCNRITLGRNVFCGPYVQFYAAYHPTDPLKRAEGPELAKPITVGSDVWFGGGVIVCPGVTIGDGVTIGAGSVVTRDIPPRVIAAGNPCRVLRRMDE